MFIIVLWILLLTQSLSTSLAFYAVVPLFNNYIVLYSALVPKLMSYIWTLRKHSTLSLIMNFFTNFGTSLAIQKEYSFAIGLKRTDGEEVGKESEHSSLVVLG